MARFNRDARAWWSKEPGLRVREKSRSMHPTSKRSCIGSEIVDGVCSRRFCFICSIAVGRTSMFGRSLFHIATACTCFLREIGWNASAIRSAFTGNEQLRGVSIGRIIDSDASARNFGSEELSSAFRGGVPVSPAGVRSLCGGGVFCRLSGAMGMACTLLWLRVRSGLRVTRGTMSAAIFFTEVLRLGNGPWC